MNQRTRTILFFVIALAAVAALVTYKYLSTRTILNDGYDGGNTGSNLYNNGLFCEHDGLLYFSNPDDHFRLYVMQRDGSDLKKLSDDVASYINVDDNYVYYTRSNASNDSQFSFLHIETNSLCRVKKSGSKVTILDHDPDLYASLVGNYVYFLHYGKSDATTLYRVKIDGKEDEKIDGSPIYPCTTQGRYLYYSGVEGDRSIYRMDTETGQRTLFFACDSWNPVIDSGYFYYMVPTDDYAIYRTNMTDLSTQKLTNDRADCFLVSGDTLVYQRNDANNPALVRVHLMTGQSEIIAEGNYHSLNAAYGRLYFLDFEDDTQILVTPLDGVGAVSPFHPGLEED